MGNLIRQLTISDFEQVEKVYSSWTGEELRSCRIFYLVTELHFELEAGLLWGIFEAGELRAFVVLFDGIAWEILLLMSHKAYQSRNWARQLLQDLFQRAHEAGIQEVWLEVSPENLRACSFYKSLGFITQGVRARYYRDGTDALNLSYQVRSL